jgi:hypothetical protein
VRGNPTRGLAAGRAGSRAHGRRTTTGIAITLDLYGHLLPSAHDAAAGLPDAFLARSAGAGGDPTATRTAPHPAESQSQSGFGRNR